MAFTASRPQMVKVTGRATYAYEYRLEDEAPLYGVIVTAKIGSRPNAGN